MSTAFRSVTGEVLAHRLHDAPAGTVAAHGVVAHGDAWEATARFTATGPAPARIERLDALALDLRPHEWSAQSFSSGWGAEFEPVAHERVHGLEVGVTSGRSSHGAHPLLILRCPAGVVLVSVAWSGNWRISIDDDGILRAGIQPRDFWLDLEPGQSVEAPAVFVATGATLADAGRALSRAVGAGIPRSAWSDAMPTEWNHWWPYEDRDITAEVFVAESEKAAQAGLEVATLDAGWFGSSDLDADWQAERGDWHRENTERFPGGLARLAERVRAVGVDAGIWIEPEALGAASRARAEHPTIVATRQHPDGAARITVSLDAADPSFLGYVCLGSADGRRFASAAMDELIERTGARWLKLDFNVDPGSGCDRTDHGHGAGDGLFRHYEGLYAVLDDFRERHPDVVVESCSSGGLRIDAGSARHVHCHFLSDPDWTEHHLQVLWGASLLLPPGAILHWAWSQWRGEHPQQKRDLATLDPAEFDRSLRAAMLHRFGVSLRLTDLPELLFQRLTAHVRAFRDEIAPLLPDAALTAASAQPRRAGEGCRTPAFQLDSPRGHVRGMFALDGLDETVTMRFDGLDAATVYEVMPLADDEPPFTATGDELGRGFSRRGASWLWRARPLAM